MLIWEQSRSESTLIKTFYLDALVAVVLPKQPQNQEKLSFEKRKVKSLQMECETPGFPLRETMLGSAAPGSDHTLSHCFHVTQPTTSRAAAGWGRLSLSLSLSRLISAIRCSVTSRKLISGQSATRQQGPECPELIKLEECLFTFSHFADLVFNPR